MSGWERTHRRYRLVYAVAADVDRRGPDAIESWKPAIEREYGSLDTFRLDVRRRWDTAVDARMDDVREQPLAEIKDAVARANRPLWLLLQALDVPQAAQSHRPQPQVA